jgi:hypothetical protein
MPNELAKKGAQTSKPTRYAPIWHNNFYLGVCTQRNPLRSALTHLEDEFYGTQPCLIDGLNTEISTKLTLIRRPGHSVYNSSTFPTINRFYENRTAIFNAAQTITSEKIQVVADTASVVYDCTGPSTSASIFNKSAGSGSAYFQSVGNSLYFTDGVDNKKYLTPNLIWAANQTYSVGDFILDTNGNLQEVTAQTININITEVQVSHGLTFGAPYVYTLTLASAYPEPVYSEITPTGMTTVTNLNGTPWAVRNISGNTILIYGPFHGNVAPTAETGSITVSGSAFTTGGTQPGWNPTPGGTTADGTLVWQNMGLPTENWQIAAPAQAPTVSGGTTDLYWFPNTLFQIFSTVLDSNGNYEVAFNINFTTTPALSGNTIPIWPTGPVNNSEPVTTVVDNQIVWTNYGKTGAWKASSTVAQIGSYLIVDTNGNLQILAGGTGTTGSSQPVWSTTLGGSTTDSGITWINAGPGTIVSTAAWQWAYSYHGLDGSLTTASPLFTISTGILGTSSSPSLTVTGPGTNDPQCDQIWIWRTVQGGSVLFFDGSIPNPGAGTTIPQNWTYTDTLPDVSVNGGPALNEFIEAPIADSSNPPPTGGSALTYHLGRIWMAVGNSVQYSQGPLVTSGNGNTAWDAENFFQYPSTVYRLWPTTNGLLVFTNSDLYVIQGLGTSDSGFFSTPFLQNLGISSYDAFAINGGVVYVYTSDNQVLTIDPSSGVSEIGSAIGDQFGPGNGTGTFNPTSTHITWNYQSSQEKALYVSDFQGTWWRMMSTPSPETGTTWSPKAQISSGFSAVQSVETSPGNHNLLLGPKTSGKILQRDWTVFTDNGVEYSAYGVVGSLVLAQPGQEADVESIITDSQAVGNPLSLAVQLDEIAPLSSGYFEPLYLYVPDPTQLSPSKSVYAQRFYLSETQMPAVCRHLQIQVNWGEDVVKNELLSLSIFGSYNQEK